MAKSLFSYFFIMILSIHITLPICMSMFNMSSEISFVIDFEEEQEDVEITKDYEAKILHNVAILLNLTKTLGQDKIIFLTKGYNSIIKNLDSPPPEFMS